MKDLDAIFKEIIRRFDELDKRIAKFETWEPQQGITANTITVGARVRNSLAPSVPNLTHTTISFNVQLFDTGNFHSTTVNPSRLTVPYSGFYYAWSNVYWDANNAGSRHLQIWANGIATQWGNVVVAASTNTTVQQCDSMLSLVAGEYIELVAYQDSGGLRSLQNTPYFSVEFGIVYLGATS